MIAAELPPAVPLHGSAVEALLLRPRTKSVGANGLQFTYLEWGRPDGPLVLCLHGFPDSPRSWDTLARSLAAHGYRVVAPWMRGYYPTQAAPDGDYRDATLGRDALALMSALGQQQAVLVGHDWGALAAYAATELAPERVRKLVVVSIPHPAAITSDAALGRANHFLTLPLPGAVRAFAVDDVSGVDRIVKKWSPRWRPSRRQLDDVKFSFRHEGGTEAILGYYRSFAKARWDLALGAPAPITWSAIKPPALLVFGTEDGAVEPRFYPLSKPYFSPHTGLVPLPGVGHFPQSEAPGKFAAVVTSFVVQ